MKKIILLLLIINLFSCNSYQKVLKSNDMDKKYDYAVNLFENEDYFKSLPLFDELATSFKGTEKGENCIFYLAYCNFYLKEYALAGFYFKNYINYFPESEDVEECLYMESICSYKDSPRLSLDQENTIVALNKLRNFINSYPNSVRVAEVNKRIKELEDKIESKDYENAKLYYDMEDYRSSIVSLDNFIKKYPGSHFTEDIYFMIIKSNFKLAEMSIVSKKPERYNSTIIVAKIFISNFPESLHINEVKSILLYSKNYFFERRN